MFKQRQAPYYDLGLDNQAGVEIIGHTMTVISNRRGAGVTILSRELNSIKSQKLGPDEVIDIKEII